MAATWVMFKGTHQQVINTFHTQVDNVVLNGVSHYANIANPQIPSALQNVVSGLQGLHNFDPVPAGDQTLKPHYVNSYNQIYLGPPELAAAYDAQPLYDAGVRGDGMSIAVIGRADIQTSDLAAYKTLFNLPQNLPQTILAGTDPGSANAADVAEAEADLEIVGAIAPNATVKYVNATSVINSLLYAIDGNVSPIIVFTYTVCEQQSTVAATTWQSYIQEANALGMTVFAASGDAGPAACDAGTTQATHGLTVNLPASVPEATAVGGTQMGLGAASSTSQFPANRTEMPWTDSGLLGSSGGGASAYFPKPVWQTGTGVPADSDRDVPDIALTAASGPESYPYATCLNGGCESGQVSASGGTSAATALTAGMFALLNQSQMAQTGQNRRDSAISTVLFTGSCRVPGRVSRYSQRHCFRLLLSVHRPMH